MLIFALLAGLNATNGEIELYDAQKNSWNVVSNYSDYRLRNRHYFCHHLTDNFRNSGIHGTNKQWHWKTTFIYLLDSLAIM